jgi:DNA-directed RNA polymerase specialized sigma24 family protein
VRPDADIPTTELAQLCREESERYRRHRRDDGDHCFELFRRAIVDRDQQAWTGVYEQYRRLVAKWVDGSPDQVDERTNRAFEKFWQAVVPQTFASKFADIGKVMAFLQMCARSVSIDEHRREEKHRLAGDLEGVQASTEDTTASHAMDNIWFEELFKHIEGRLRDDPERRVFHLSFRVGLSPKQIVQQYPDQFSDVTQVRRIKERVVRRLATDPQLQAWWRNSTRLGKDG